MSPELGQLDEAAFDDFLAEHPDAAMALLADLTGAIDSRLKVLSRKLAGRIFVEVARTGPARSRGVGPPRARPADQALGDLDLDRSQDALLLSRASGVRPRANELHVIELGKRSTALCLVVDRSGSMGGDRLATAAVAAAACSWRAGPDHSVVAFNDTAIVVQSQGQRRSPASVTDDLLRLRGHGPTDLAGALDAAAGQLVRSNARRKLTVLLSDCRATAGAEPLSAARRAEELVILAPADDRSDADTLARTAGARVQPVTGPSSVPSALAALLE